MKTLTELRIDLEREMDALEMTIEHFKTCKHHHSVEKLAAAEKLLVELSIEWSGLTGDWGF